MARITYVFEDHYEVILKEINKRRLGWTLTSVSFDDLRQKLLIHVSQKIHKFDSRKLDKDGKPVQFTHWLQKTVSNQIRNELRNNYTKFAKPCIQGCPFNTGNETCSKTPSGLQCSECAIYKDWEKRKKDHHNVAQTLPLENHRQEVHNIGADFTDVAKCKEVIDLEIKKLLTKYEWKMYRMLYIQGMEPAKVGKALGYRKSGRLHHGYLQILRFRHKVVALSKTIIAEHNLV